MHSATSARTWQARVVRDYRTEYPDPIGLSTGQRVRVGREDDEFPGWRWCLAADGRQGWVPVELLRTEGDEAVVSEDYEATELDVCEGDRVTVERERRGWLWVSDARGRRGWIPVSHVVVEKEGT
jgi:SH3-like domain-containing protein